MQTAQRIKIGPFLVISSVLAVWTFLAAQPVQAHTLTNPSCSGLPNAAFLTATETAALSVPASAGAAVTGTVTMPKPGTSESGGGNRNYYYAKITVPALTAGELVVTDSTAASATYSSEGILCGRQEGNVSSLPSYASAHISADNAAAAALRAQTTAAAAPTSGAAATNAERAARSALITAANALASYSGTTLVGGIARALQRAAAATSGTAADTLTAAASAAIAESDTARVAGGRDAISTADTGSIADDTATAEAGALGDAAEDLRIAAHALDPNMVFTINTLISSGDEEYVVVMTVPEGGTPGVSVTFRGVMSTGAADGGSFTQNNQRDTYTLRATDPGLLTVRTTGNEVDTKGTLSYGTADIAMNAGSGGNFEIVSPMDDDVDYSVHVEGQTRGERGDYGLKLAFGVAEELVSGGGDYTDTTLSTTELEPGRADYFFFTTADAATGGDRFLTVQTRKHTDVTTETDTTGAFYGQAGQIVTDTNSGTGNNFLLRAPVAAVKDYIIEVTGARSSTKGKYVLETTSTAAPSQGSAPDGIMTSTTGTEITTAGEVDPHSITVTKAGTLQVKTTGSTDTVGILYGPDGRQIATDDNSGAGMNFLITQYVEAGQYVVTVEGKSRRVTSASYTLVTNFVEGATVGGPTTPTTPGGDDDVASLQAEVTRLRNALNECRDPVVTDARGNLENPPDDGYRSGIGLISGWVCAAEDVEVRILSDRGIPRRTLQVAYGTSRPDTVGQCRGHDSPNTGFGMTYNFNHLPEGEYTITAYADGDTQIGDSRTFTVVHIQGFAADDENRFLELDDDVQDRGECIVEDFPVTGEQTWLKWEESTQNFVIEDHE